jgi:hypothetical protein
VRIILSYGEEGYIGEARIQNPSSFAEALADKESRIQKERQGGVLKSRSQYLGVL